MDSSCSSQKKIRRVLRSSQFYQKPAIKRITNNVKSGVAWNKLKPKKSSSLIEHDNFINDVGVEPKKPSPRVEHDKFIHIGGEPKKSTRVEHDKLNDGGGYEKSKIGKVMSKMNKPTGTKKVFSHQSENLDSDEFGELENLFNSNGNHVDDDLPALSHNAERERPNQAQDEELKEVNQFNAGDQEECEDDDEEDEQENEQEKDQEEDHQFEAVDEDVENDRGNQNFQNNAADTDTESLSGDCLLGMLKGFNKDIGALYTKTNSIEDDIKEIKRVLKSRPTQNCTFRSLSSQFKQSSAYSLLPKFPLLKKSHVRKMESNAEENEEYKSQMISKLASYGGKSVKELMINIFNKLFSPKLKTKYCWRGSTKGKGKAPFKKLKNIIEVLWLAVQVHFEACTEDIIIKEIKLRLNQALKDYDREMEKQNKE